ncbi:MAG TPA: gliding motility-associated C-terminal domain-containing protein [Saprospiraceae bacterium]|nr:gliding motility-associated C-terminal domain-containing protein [Saprospiraceae bacterium]
MKKIIKLLFFIFISTTFCPAQIRVGFAKTILEFDPNNLCNTSPSNKICNRGWNEYDNFTWGPNGELIFMFAYGNHVRFGKSTALFNQCDSIQKINEAILPYRNVLGLFSGSIPDFFDYAGRHYFIVRIEEKSHVSVFVLDDYRTSKTYRELPIQLPLGFRVAEVLFIKDKIYILEGDLPRRIFVYDLNYQLLNIITPPYPIEKMTTRVIDCDSIKVYGFGLYPRPFAEDTTYFNDTLQLFVEQKTDSMIIFDVDLGTNTFDSLCVIKMPTKEWLIFNVSSSTEFLASETECDLLIDLDRNNSGQFYPYDFAPKENLCFGDTARVTDEDVYIHTSFLLDSIYIQLSGVRDGINEFLSLNNLPLGMRFSQTSPTNYILYSDQKLSDSTYMMALRNLIYHNESQPKTYGVRTISFQGVNQFKRSALIHSYITIGVTVQKDTAICANESFVVDNKNYSIGDTITDWILVSSGCDTLIQTIISGLDTASVAIEGDTIICNNISPELYYTGPELIYKWHTSDGVFFQKNIKIQKEDTVSLKITNDLGCTSSKTVVVKKVPDITIDIPDTIFVTYNEDFFQPLDVFGDSIINLMSPFNEIKWWTSDTIKINTSSPFNTSVTFYGSEGCWTQNEIFVKLLEAEPNDGTPNAISLSSATNNVWQPFFPEYIDILQCEIYDRWGNMVYQWKQGEILSWSGQLQGKYVKQGVFVYHIATLNNSSGKVNNYFGDLLVLR